MSAEGRVLDDLDAVDLGIVRLLQDQGRTTNARIARELGVSEPTVRKRIDRLMQDEIIKVVAVLNPRMTGYQTDVLIGIRVQPGSLLAVGEALSRCEEVVYLGYTTGRHDILVEMLFRDDEALFEFLNGQLPSLGPIVSTETYHVLRTGKINYDWKLPIEFGDAQARATRPLSSSPDRAPRRSARPSPSQAWEREPASLLGSKGGDT
ncbi:MAG TPA: Lrp/AsnC family transcriptional regulator [Candidatus Dormibacteraeota bacterium]|nr:Lrp/AsnC family transcriptional regulator [Candidatus Dormibacteraeota bacterium]